MTIPINKTAKTLEERLAEEEKLSQSKAANNESFQNDTSFSNTHEGELIQETVNLKPLKVEQAMKELRLQKIKRSLKISIDEDAHDDLKIICIKERETQEEYLGKLIMEDIKKKKKKYNM